jgi:hypothetical protein
MTPIQLDPKRLLGFRLDARDVVAVAMPGTKSAAKQGSKTLAKRGGKTNGTAGYKTAGRAGNKLPPA